MNDKFEFEVALSFAGEDRVYVEKIAGELKSRGINVFYDEYETAKLWGKNLSTYLSEVYYAKSRHCIPFISKNYPLKEWPKLERESALARALKEEEYLLPIRLDSTTVPGILPTISFIDSEKYTIHEICDFVEEKIRSKSPLYTVTNGSDLSESLSKVNYIAELIKFGKYSEIENLVYSATREYRDKLLSTDLYPNETPNKENFFRILYSLEEITRDLLPIFIGLSKANNPADNQIIIEAFREILQYKYNESTGKRYIWVSISRYSILLLFYAVGIISMRTRNYKLLIELCKLDLTENIGYNCDEYEFKVFQLVNPYHLFNEVNGFIMHTYEYIPNESEVTLAWPQLVANLRLYNVLKEFLISEFVDEQQLEEYFDLFEFLLGLLFIEMRIGRGNEEPFGLYGLNFRKYSKSFDDLLESNTEIGKFLRREIESQDSEFLKAGFFEGKKDRFVDVLRTYITFLRTIR